MAEVGFVCVFVCVAGSGHKGSPAAEEREKAASRPSSTPASPLLIHALTGAQSHTELDEQEEEEKEEEVADAEAYNVLLRAYAGGDRARLAERLLEVHAAVVYPPCLASSLRSDTVQSGSGPMSLID